MDPITDEDQLHVQSRQSGRRNTILSTSYRRHGYRPTGTVIFRFPITQPPKTLLANIHGLSSSSHFHTPSSTTQSHTQLSTFACSSRLHRPHQRQHISQCTFNHEDILNIT